jgi:hypothetical protein
MAESSHSVSPVLHALNDRYWEKRTLRVQRKKAPRRFACNSTIAPGFDADARSITMSEASVIQEFRSTELIGIRMHGGSPAQMHKQDFSVAFKTTIAGKFQ